MSLNQSLFRQALARRLDGIKRLCRQWGVPQLGTRVTLILRDPANDEMSVLLTDEETLAEAVRVARRLEDGAMEEGRE